MKTETLRNINRLTETGISHDDALALRRISMTLHRWYELECGDGNDYSSWSIIRDESTDKPYMEIHPHTGKSYKTPIPDREKGAIKRLDKIIANYPGLSYYLQTDPRAIIETATGGQSIPCDPLQDVSDKRAPEPETVQDSGEAIESAESIQASGELPHHALGRTSTPGIRFLSDAIT